MANYFAMVEGITMSDQHWEIVNYLREYYKRYQIAPRLKILLKEIGMKFGPQKGARPDLRTGVLLSKNRASRHIPGRT